MSNACGLPHRHDLLRLVQAVNDGNKEDETVGCVATQNERGHHYVRAVRKTAERATMIPTNATVSTAAA